MKNRRANFRPSPIDFLEDRAVPSAGLVSSQGIAAQVNAAYAEFATSVRQAELTLLPAGNVASTGTTVSVAIRIAQDAAILQGRVASALGQPGNGQGLLAQQLNGTSPGSLRDGLAQVLGAASAGSVDGRVAPATLPLLFAAIDGTVAASYDITATEIALYTTGLDPSGSTLNPARYGGQVNAAYATFATNVRQAEAQLVSPGGPMAAPNASIVFGQQAQALARSIVGPLAGTSVASKAAVIRGQFVGDRPGNLGSQLAGLLAASTAGTPDGSVPQSSMPLLITSVEAAINSSREASAIEGYLLASEAGPAPASTGGGTSGSSHHGKAAGHSNGVGNSVDLNGGGATPTNFVSYGVFFAR